ncbi:MAG: ATP-grasp domain-containing protein [Thermoleophilia bacterium]|nr:ATP-grasp domain-containing protein [Thermoleophilia bacterium]MDH5333638.1 ATP-grasp domain-containing protein [Thermoleophilia bacterium]
MAAVVRAIAESAADTRARTVTESWCLWPAGRQYHRAGMKTVLIVGAGRYQRAVIRRARELGLRVVAVDRNPDAPGLAEADIGRVVDFADPGAVLAAVADLEIDGVTTVQAERAVPMVARLAEELGVPGIGAGTARLLTHKVSMRRRLAEAGVPQPRFTTLRASEDAARASAEVPFPAVLKPGAGSGQHGVFRVESAAEVASHLDEALAVSPGEEAILEEYVDGIEMNGIVVVRQGRVLLAALGDRLRPSGIGFGVSWIHLYPPHVEGDSLAASTRVAVDTARTLGLETGIAFPQLIATTDGRVLVVECAARIGGMMAELLEHALGIDLLEIQLRLALGDEVTEAMVRPRFERPTAIRFLTAQPGHLRAGRVTRVGPLGPVLASPGVVDASIYSVVGETIRPVQVISDRRGYVIATGETREQALQRADAAAALVEIEVEEVR